MFSMALHGAYSGMEQARTYRLVTKDDALISRLVADIERLLHHERDLAERHDLTYKVVPPLSHEARGFTRFIYMHTRTDKAAVRARQYIHDLSALTCNPA